jgi:hypothetical protein
MFNWDKSKLKENALRLLQAGITQKYKLLNSSELQLNMMYTKTTNECKWVVNVKDINDKGYIIELFTLENIITETNNEMVHDLAAYKNLFREVYDELVLEIDFFGNLIAVRNLKMLQEKWQRVRADLEKSLKQHPEVGSVITLNDTLFNNHENVKAIIQALEFFELFFPGFYGKALPAHVQVMRYNRLKSQPFKWWLSFSYPSSYSYYETGQPLQINFEGTIAEALTMQKVEERYGKFEFLNNKTFKPEFKCNGSFLLNRASGLIEQAEYQHHEILDKELLFTINNYSLSTYE